MKNLLEEIQRIKGLIVFDKGKSLTEQEEKEEKKTVEECFEIVEIGSFPVNVTSGSKAVENFIKKLRENMESHPKFKEKKEGSKLYVKKVSMFGGASNYFKAPVEPDFDNEYNKWSPSSKGYVEGKSYSGSKDRNNALALKRAKGVHDALLNSLGEETNKYGIVYDPTKEPDFTSGTIFTNNNVDKSNSGLKPGQIVRLEAVVCYDSGTEGGGSKEELIKGCTDKKAKNYNDKATEDDGSCEYEKGEVVKGCTDKKASNYNDKATEDDGSCKFEKEKIKGCTDKKASNYNEKANVDDGSCKYTESVIKCNMNEKISGKQGSATNNFVSYILKDRFPSGAGNKLTVTLNPLVVPDAFYMKYGDQEYWSGFRGKSWDTKFKYQYAPQILKALKTDGYVFYDTMMRLFLTELVFLNQKSDLLGKIKNEVSKNGGNPSVVDTLFNGYNTAERILNKFKKGGDKKKSYKTLKTFENQNGTFEKTFTKDSNESEFILIVFGPLDNTIFNLSTKCE